MVRWMRRLARRAATILHPTTRRRGARAASPALEGLERREAPSGSGGPALATLAGRIDRPGRDAFVAFRVEPGRFVSDRGMPVILGLEASPAPGASVEPQVVRLVGLPGESVARVATKDGPFLARVILPVDGPNAYAVDVHGREGTTGDFVVRVTLPGDVNGDGSVDRIDIGRLRKAYGTQAGSRHFDPAADVNGDGRIGHVDLGLARRNLGARASVVALAPTSLPPELARHLRG